MGRTLGLILALLLLLFVLLLSLFPRAPVGAGGGQADEHRHYHWHWACRQPHPGTDWADGKYWHADPHSHPYTDPHHRHGPNNEAAHAPYHHDIRCLSKPAPGPATHQAAQAAAAGPASGARPAPAPTATPDVRTWPYWYGDLVAQCPWCNLYEATANADVRGALVIRHHNHAEGAHVDHLRHVGDYLRDPESGDTYRVVRTERGLAKVYISPDSAEIYAIDWPAVIGANTWVHRGILECIPNG